MKKVSEFLEEYAFSIDLNMNDVFAPAADSETIDCMEIPGLIHIEEKFGWSGVKAFVGTKRKYDPCWKQPVNEEYLNAKKYIEENYASCDEGLYLKSVAKPICDGKAYFVDLAKFAKENSV